MERSSMVLEGVSLREIAGILLCKAQEAASIDAPIMSFNLICDLERIVSSTHAMVRRMRNSCQRSISLPPEILSAIFQHVPGGPGILDYDPLWQPSYVNTIDLIPLTHVCHRWREVALSTPSLWCSISDLDPAAFLERSGSMDLFLTITKEPKADHFIHDLLRSHGSRIREMYWSADVSKSAAPLYLHLGSPALRLKVLKIRSGYSSLCVERPDAFHFQAHTPQLEYVSLRSTLWVPSESILSLTRLCLSDIPNSVANPAVDAILSLLSRTPNLEALVMMHQGFEGPAKTSNMVRLKNLVRLTFESMDSQDISELMGHLDIGSSVAVQAIDCDFNVGGGSFSFLTDLALLPTSMEVAGKGNSNVIVSTVNSSSALRCISYNWLFDGGRVLEQAEQYVRELWIRSCDRNTFAAIVARDWIQLETLVSCDYALGPFLEYLSTPLELRCARGLSTIRLIQTSLHKNLDLSVQQCIKERFMLARKDCPAIKLVIESHVLQRDAGQRVTEDVEALFESVEYKFFEQAPTMTYPDVCNSGWSTK